MPAEGVGHHIFGGKKLHKDVIFPDFPAFPAFHRTIASAPAVPPFSWLGVDAWPHFPAWADKQA